MGTATADDTLLEGLNYQGGRDLAGAAQILLRAASSAVLNAASVNYPLSLGQIQTLVNNALASGDRDTMTDLNTVLDGYNNARCPFN